MNKSLHGRLPVRIDEAKQRLHLRQLEVVRSPSVGTKQDEAGHWLGTTGSASDGYQPRSDGAEKGKPLQAQAVYNRFDVEHPGIKREVRRVPVRQPGSPAVIPDEHSSFAQLLVRGAVRGDLPI